MLVIRPLPAGGHRYLTSGIDPAERWGEAPGRWVGRGAALLGLAEQVDPARLGLVLAGQAPDGSGPLCAARANRRCGLELVFAAPKSMSVTALLAPHDLRRRLVDAHRDSVVDAIDYLDDHACAVRRRGRPVEGDGVVAAAFVHRISRADDPHLHSHVLVANLSRGGDERWCALFTPAVFRESGAAGAVYAASLRWRTSELGMTWTQVDQGRYELEHVPRRVIEAFSRRRAAVVARGTGATSDDVVVPSLPAAVRLTRPSRPVRTDFDALADSWMARAEELAFDPPAPSRTPAQVQASAVPSGLENVIASRDVFRRGDLVHECANRHRVGAPPAVIAARVDATLASGEVIPIDQMRFTTRSVQVRRRALGGRFEERGDIAVVDLPRGRGRTDFVDGLSRHAHLDGTELWLIAPSLTSARSMEALTGVVSGTPSVDVGPNPTLVIVDADRFSTDELARLTERRGPAILIGTSGRSATFDRLLGVGRPYAGRPAVEPRGATAAVISTRPGPVTIHETVEQARAASVASWHAARTAGRDAILVAPEGELDRFGLGSGAVLTPSDARRAGPYERIVLGGGPLAPGAPTSRHVVGRLGVAFAATPPGLRVTLGQPPPGLEARACWLSAARSLAAYRARWNVELDGPLRETRLEQRVDRRRTMELIGRARRDLGLAPLAIERGHGLSR